MGDAVPVSLRRDVVMRAAGQCAYCQSTERLMGIEFEIDHIVPRAAGGATSLDNLCLSCPSCNRHKASRTQASDPETGEIAPLFHPIHQSWSEHFEWIDNGIRLVGRTQTGRATVVALHLNRAGIVQTRRYWVILGLHPPRS